LDLYSYIMDKLRAISGTNILTGTGHEVLAIVGDELIRVIACIVSVIADPNPILPD
jgi:hypothetical protein